MTERESRHAELAVRYLPDDLLERLRERAARYDRDNAFPTEDLEELTALGYLTVLVPERRGGGGLSLHEVSRLQQGRAGAAPATALAVNMHLMCTAVVRMMLDRGDDSLGWVLDQAAAGEIFAFGISEPSNDWVLQGSTTSAVPMPGDARSAENGVGYLLSGTKIFTSLSPVWTRLLVHGLDASDPAAPQLVYGFVERGAPGVEIGEDWDVLGMRASHSRTTVLREVPMLPQYVARRIEPGNVPDLLTFAIAAAFQLLLGSVYAGIARRALDVAADGLRHRRSAKAEASLAEVPEYRARLAREYLTFQAVPTTLEALARDVDERVEHGTGWPLRLVAARLAATRAARSGAETALVCTSGRGFGNGAEASRLLRDATAGLFHPPSEEAALPMYAAALLDD
jgi:alkylation response protein AidB-like acyl-CoA dehydrogenase